MALKLNLVWFPLAGHRAFFSPEGSDRRIEFEALTKESLVVWFYAPETRRGYVGRLWFGKPDRFYYRPRISRTLPLDHPLAEMARLVVDTLGPPEPFLDRLVETFPQFSRIVEDLLWKT